MCEEEIEERLLELIRAMPYNQIKYKHTMCRRDIYTYENFRFEVIDYGCGVKCYFLNKKEIEDEFGSEIEEILEEKLSQLDRDKHFNFLQSVIEELTKWFIIY